MDPCGVWQTDWQDLEVERKPIPGYSPQGESKEAPFSQRASEGGSVGGNGDRESHSTKLSLSCLRDM